MVPPFGLWRHTHEPADWGCGCQSHTQQNSGINCFLLTPPYHSAYASITELAILYLISSVQFSHSVMSDSLRPHESQHTRPPCPSQTPSLLKLMSIESVMPSSHLILCHPLLLLPPILPSIRVFSNESTLRLRWPLYSIINYYSTSLTRQSDSRGQGQVLFVSESQACDGQLGSYFRIQ